MKKVKMMITAMAVLAVVGGALAFKAKTTLAGSFLYTKNGSECLLAPGNFVEDPAGIPAFGTITTTSDTPPADCNSHILVIAEP